LFIDSIRQWIRWKIQLTQGDEFRKIMAKKAATIESFVRIDEEISSGNFSPVYFFLGDETYFTDYLTTKIEKSVVPEEARSFNQTILYGKETNGNDLVSIAKRYPMMSDYQLVVVKDAQDLKDADALVSYLENPLQSTVLVMAYRKSKLDKRSKLAKLASKYTFAEFIPLRDYQMKDWLPVFAEKHGRRIDSDGIQRLIDLIGANLSKIHNELDKIFATVKDEFIRDIHIEEHVGFNREYNVFELQKALGDRNFNKAVQIAHQMSATMEKGEMMRTLPVLHKYFSNVLLTHGLGNISDSEIASKLGVNPYFVRDYLTAKRNYSVLNLEGVLNKLKYLDLRLKGVNRGAATDGDLLIETVVGILKS